MRSDQVSLWQSVKAKTAVRHFVSLKKLQKLHPNRITLPQQPKNKLSLWFRVRLRPDHGGNIAAHLCERTAVRGGESIVTAVRHRFVHHGTA